MKLIGFDLGSLVVYAINNAKNITRKIYAREGTHGDEWMQAFVSFTPQDYTFDFSLAVDSIAGKKIEGFYALFFDRFALSHCMYHIFLTNFSYTCNIFMVD